jgi:putative transposase
MPEQTGRRSIRLKGFDYSQAGAYFVTIVSRGRECLFGEIAYGEVHFSSLGLIANECWRSIPDHFLSVGLDGFVVMPNHVHGIVFLYDNDRAIESTRRGTIYRAPTNTTSNPAQFGKPMVGSLPTIIRTYKAAVTRRVGRELNSGNVWQRNYLPRCFAGL